jgi:hypothetical protein
MKYLFLKIIFPIKKNYKQISQFIKISLTFSLITIRKHKPCDLIVQKKSEKVSLKSFFAGFKFHKYFCLMIFISLVRLVRNFV